MKKMMPHILPLAALALAGVVGPAAPAFAASGLSITARQVRLGDTPDTVVLVGGYTCGPYAGGAPERGVIDLGVSQVVDGVTVTGIGYLEPTVCTGQPQRYAVELTAYTGSFASGRATWSASGYLEGPDGLQHVFVPPRHIRIRPAAE